MKSIKRVALIVLFIALFLGLTIYMVRTPSYTIKTTGKLYIVNKLSKNITVFDLNRGSVVNTILLSQLGPHEITTLANQQNVVVTNYGDAKTAGKDIWVINTKTDKLERKIDLEGSLRPRGIVAFKNSNSIGLVSNISNELLVVDIKNNTILKKIATQQAFNHLLALHPFKPLAFISNITPGSVSVIDLIENKVIKIIPCSERTEGIALTPDGKEVWVSNTEQSTIHIINTETFQITDSLTTGQEPLRLAFTIDGKYCLVANALDGTIVLYDSAAKKQLKTIHIPGKKTLLERLFYHTPRPVNIVMHPNGLYAFIANSNADKIEVLDMKTLKIVSTIGTGRVPEGMTFVE